MNLILSSTNNQIKTSQVCYRLLPADIATLSWGSMTSRLREAQTKQKVPKQGAKSMIYSFRPLVSPLFLHLGTDNYTVVQSRRLLPAGIHLQIRLWGWICATWWRESDTVWYLGNCHHATKWGYGIWVTGVGFTWEIKGTGDKADPSDRKPHNYTNFIRL